MKVGELGIKGAWVFTPKQFADPRGVFLEWFREDRLIEAVGHPLRLAQANCSVSSRGVLRGIHYADVPPSQAKYVTCSAGAVLDVVIDIRVGSPTFGQWESVQLDAVDRKAVYLCEGLGHAFMSLEDGSTVNYLCSEGYSPTREHGIHPLDPEIAIAWPDMEIHLSDKDALAPSLADALAAGVLPTMSACKALYQSLR